MEPVGLILLIVFFLRRLLDQPNPEPDLVKLNRQAEQFAAQGNYVQAEDKLRRLLRIMEKRQGPHALEMAPYLRRLACLKMEQDDKEEAELLVQRVLAIQEKH